MNSQFETRAVCPCCGSQSQTTLYQSPYSEPPLREYLERFYSEHGPGVEFEYLEGVDYVLRECGTCAAIFQRDVPGPKLMGRLYGHWIKSDEEDASDRLNPGRDASYYRWAASSIADAIDATGKLPPRVKFLDVGMGRGNWCMLAKGFGCEAFGIELAEAHVENARRMGISVRTWEDLQNEKFDVINAEQVFEHLAQPLATLEVLERSLSPNGVIRIGVPPCRDVKRRLAVADWSAPLQSPNSLNMVAPLQHINFFAKESLLVMGRKLSLERSRRRETPGTRSVRQRLLGARRLAGAYKRSLRHKLNLETFNVSTVLLSRCGAE